MPTLNELLIFEHENEHVLEHDLPQKRTFSNPKIYSANGKLDKRWYVYFSFRNPKTGKLERMKNIYGIVNKYKTKEERFSILSCNRVALLKLLRQGYNPYADNTALHQKRNSKKIPKKTISIEEQSMSIQESFDFGLKLKSKLLNDTTKRSYENRVKNFLKWMNENHSEIERIDQLNKKIVTNFFNSVLERTSARNRNNYRTELSSIVQVLEDNDIITNNFIKKIPVLKSIPERNKTYTQETQEDIFNYLEDKDPVLLLYIKFISYNFLRPIEVSRLKVGDIDLNTKTIQFKAKNSPLKTKIIPEILWNDLPDLSLLKKDTVLFTPEGYGMNWDTQISNRRDFFTKRFKKVVKDHFKLGTDYGLYSFRHTYITKLYRALVKESSPFEAKSKLMQITGHSSMSALEKYLRDIDAELPQDYSEMLKKTNE